VALQRLSLLALAPALLIIDVRLRLLGWAGERADAAGEIRRPGRVVIGVVAGVREVVWGFALYVALEMMAALHVRYNSL
jgi:hypothetical protein